MNIRRRLQGHKTTSKVQGPDEYARAQCACGARFQALDGRFFLHDFGIWEKKHAKPGATA